MDKHLNILDFLLEIQNKFEQLSQHPDYQDLLESTQICWDISLGDSLQRVDEAVALLKKRRADD